MSSAFPELIKTPGAMKHASRALASAQPQNGESDRRDERRCASAVRHATRVQNGENRWRRRSENRGTEKAHRTVGATSRVRLAHRTEKTSGAMKHALRAPASIRPQNAEDPRRDERHFVSAVKHTLCPHSPAARARKRPIGSYGPIGLGARMRTGRVPKAWRMKRNCLVFGE